MAVFFDSSKLPTPAARYVLWLDGMGTGNFLTVSLHHAANFVGKLHVATTRAASGCGARVYPMMDGAYVVTDDQASAMKFVREVFGMLAAEFTEAKPRVTHRFMARIGVAFGPTIEGRDIAVEAFAPSSAPGNALTMTPEEAKTASRSLLLSPAMLWAYRSETRAPPFGTFIHESARILGVLADSSDSGFHRRLWKWWRTTDPLVRRLAKALIEHLNHCAERIHNLSYSPERLATHKALVREYFGAFLD